jgi:hypothetical protein
MTEQIRDNQEIIRALPTESLAETMSRIHELPYEVHGADVDVPDDKDCYLFHLVANKDETNGQEDAIWYVDPSGYDKIPITGDDEIGMRLTSQLSQELRTVVEKKTALLDRWWDTDVQYGLRADAEKGVSDALRLHIGNDSIEVANLTSEKLTEDERKEVIETIERVNAFTGGRLLENTRGIALRDNDQFPEGTDGTHSTYGRFISANLGSMREHPEAAPRYGDYFGDTPPSRLQTILAHELGHAMDLIYGQYHFDDKFGWEKIEDRDNYDRELDCVGLDENVTTYGNVSPAEDFAELFAIMALGGDVSKLPNKAQAMIEYIQSHRTEGFIGPQRAKVEELNGLTPHIPQRIAVKGYVNAELLAGV